jgi:hypothetical protein
MPDPASPFGPPAAEAPSTDTPTTDRPIPLLRWPDQEAERLRLVALGEPRILLISQYATPPGLLDDLELWILDGADPSEILAAMDELRRRTRERQAKPTLDGAGLLWFKGRWVSVPDTQLAVARVLVSNVNRLVPTDELRATYQAGGGSTSDSSFRTVMHRLSHRVTRVGLVLHMIRRRGAMLATTPPEAPGRGLAAAPRG